ncbi:hypothetical protein F4861DRAFT_548562 [Xylaria intraflava]|nr:hypothetical protein F4861DRAFT_548562 [Xylaria intraflava]
MSFAGGSISRMSPELWLEILDYFVPSDAPTTVPIQSSKVELRPHVLEYRRTLWDACLVSRHLGASARIRLYEAILINNCKELLYLFRTLRTVPELRTLVRSFSWTGTFPQSDEDDTECVDLMPCLVAVFTSLPPPVTEEDALLHEFLQAGNLTAFRAWRLLSVVLAIIPRVTTLFLALGRLMPGPRHQQWLIDVELGGGGTPEEREDLFRFRQTAYESEATRALLWDPLLKSIGYPLLPELRVLILDHISNSAPTFPAFDIGDIINHITKLCPRLRYIQTKDCISLSFYNYPTRSASMKSLLVRKQLQLLSTLPLFQEYYPNLTSLRLVAAKAHGENIDAFAALPKLRHLQYLSLTNPHHLTWFNPHELLTMSRYLRGMESLQHLRIDFIFLVPKSDPGLLLRLASLLPPSIRSLHLLDYWGISMTSTDRDRHPVFPDNKSAAEFMRLMLENLLQGYSSMGLASLRKVKLSSGEYAKDCTGTRESLKKLIWEFSRAGICLTVTGHEEAREEEEQWWLNLD